MTTNPWYASNARELLDMRRQGLKPEHPVNVSLMGQVPDAGLTLYVREGMPVDRLEWRMLVNLPVVVWADSGEPFDRIMATVWAIAKARPHGLQLCFLHSDSWHLIDCGSGLHIPAVKLEHQPEKPAADPLHTFFWHPLNAGCTPFGYRLKAAMTKTHKPGVTL